jgi:hypothetical protein
VDVPVVQTVLLGREGQELTKVSTFLGIQICISTKSVWFTTKGFGVTSHPSITVSYPHPIFPSAVHILSTDLNYPNNKQFRLTRSGSVDENTATINSQSLSGRKVVILD